MHAFFENKDQADACAIGVSNLAKMSHCHLFVSHLLFISKCLQITLSPSYCALTIPLARNYYY